MKRLPLLAAAVAVLAMPAAPAHASHSQYTIFEAPREVADPALRDQTFDEIKRLGVTHVRALLYWNSVAPHRNSKKPPAGFVASDPASGYDWSRYDAIIDAASARGIKVMFTITGPVPRWATAHRSGHTYKPTTTQFERFVTAVGRRYGSRVSTWSIWNEPNHPDFLTPQFSHHRAYSPVRYAALYRAAL